jgi:hypothetical protein
MIEIKVTIEEEDDGVSVTTKAMSIGTGKEAVFGMAIIEAIQKSAKEVCGHDPETRRYFSKIAPLGDG